MNSVMALPRARILGGAFGLETPDWSQHVADLPFDGPHTRWFLNVRCALKTLCEFYRPTFAWLPSYLCATLIEPFELSGINVGYYPVNGQLECADDSFLESVRPGDFLLVLHYFGFPHEVALAEKATARGARVIEDASQALFLRQQFAGSSCILYSPRKFLGVPDGAIMVSHSDAGTSSAELSPPPRDWWKLAVRMSLERRDFDRTGCSNDWFPLFRRSECHMPVGSYRASDLSCMLLLGGIDYSAIRVRRRRNYLRLLEQLREYAFFPEVGESIVPLGFPVRVPPEWRDSILLHLHRKEIFAPTHWPLEGVVPSSFRESHELAKSLLTLVCDQRLDEDDMDRQAAEFKLALREVAKEKSVR